MNYDPFDPQKTRGGGRAKSQVRSEQKPERHTFPSKWADAHSDAAEMIGGGISEDLQKKEKVAYS